MRQNSLNALIEHGLQSRDVQLDSGKTIYGAFDFIKGNKVTRNVERKTAPLEARFIVDVNFRD